MDRISKSELVAKIASIQNITKVQASNILDTVLEVIANEVAEGTAVHLGNRFGTFKPHITKASMKRLPDSQTPISVPAKQVIKFVPSSGLKSTVNTLK